MNGGTIDLFDGALEIAGAVNSRSVTAVHVIEAALARIAKVDKAVNAFTVVLGDDAIAAAQRVDNAVANGTNLPLAGVPLAVKDHIWVKGALAANGSRLLADFIPTEDSVPVSRAMKAGAVVIGKTNNPEFCYDVETSPLFGSTLNPYDQSLTPGGSSAGSAVAVAAGMTPLAMGTDGGGSIRVPSAFCGIVGHKPTFGIVPTKPGFRGWPTLSVHGPMGRSVEDVAAMLAVIAGPDPADPATVPVDTDALFAAGEGLPDLRGTHAAFTYDFGLMPPIPEIRDRFNEILAVFEQLGCKLVEDCPDAEDPGQLFWTICAAESFAAEGAFLENESLLDPFSIRLLSRGSDLSAADYLDAQDRRAQLARTWGRFLQGYAFLISPSEPVLPFRVREGGPDGDESWWGKDAIANLTGQPVTAVPCGLSSQGLPVGLQIMGRRYEDAAVLSAAATFLRELAPVHPPPPFGPPAPVPLQPSR
jgi:Asp-tRNA(Asn)/Glu-tRNA(Gln) amidotransferase A subunit family amidase